MSKSDPSSPSSINGRQSSSASSLREGKTRLLADLPLTANRDRELRYKFLNDCSTTEQENLTSQYLSARESSDRHQILARRNNLGTTPPPR